MPPEPFKFDGMLSEWKCQQYLRLCKGTVLDYGCHRGAMVNFLWCKGWDVDGYDINLFKIWAAKSRYLGRFYSKLPKKKYDTVIAWNVLEHIEDDQAALDQMLKMARKRVVLSVPKEDDISLPDSGATYRTYVDPTHKHYYTEDRIMSMLPKYVSVTFGHTTRVKPLMAYVRLGIPKWLCSVLDNIFWAIGRNKNAFHSTLTVVIDK